MRSRVCCGRIAGVASGFWIIGCAVFAFAAFDRWYSATTKAKELCEQAPPPLPALPPDFCLEAREYLQEWPRLQHQAGSALSDMEITLAALSVPRIVIITSILAWKVSRWVFRGVRQA